MAVGKATLPTMHPIAGFSLGVAAAGIKKPGRKDLALMLIEPGASVAACFTKNAFCAAPVQVAKRHLEQASPRALVVNTGNANAGTGAAGVAKALESCARAAEIVGCEVVEVLPYSTGVIGEPLPVEKILTALPDAWANCREDGWQDAAQAILTTDTRPKGASCELVIGGERIAITGIAKGAGMIKPNMATMLAYVATDARIDGALLQKMLARVVDRSFNRITVDGDTSTNDAVTLVATGQSNAVVDKAHSEPFERALEAVLLELAQAIIRDGEGATKFVTVEVAGGRSSEECLKVAYTVAESPLVKTALFASDPNWGRILAAIGRAGVDHLEVENVRVWLGDVLIVESGGRAVSYTEAAGQTVMEKEDIVIAIHLGRGDAVETVWTTDLSHDYVTINAEYRT